MRLKYWFPALRGTRDRISNHEYSGPASSGLGESESKKENGSLVEHGGFGSQTRLVFSGLYRNSQIGHHDPSAKSFSTTPPRLGPILQISRRDLAAGDSRRLSRAPQRGRRDPAARSSRCWAEFYGQVGAIWLERTPRGLGRVLRPDRRDAAANYFPNH